MKDNHGRNKPYGFATRAIHEGYDAMSEQGAITPPVYMTSAYEFENVEQGADIFSGKQPGFFYSRFSNPTLAILEDRLASLEGAEAGLAFSSGMGAITATLWALLEAGDEIIVDETLYGHTFAFVRNGLTKFGVTVKHVNLADPAELEKNITPETKLVFFESPTNPNMRLVDIKAISDIARANGAMTIVDNTYPTPYLCRPLSLGADIVVHSATKYLGGHGDIVGGLAVGSADDIALIRRTGLCQYTGAVMAPMTAYLILRGMKTLELRMDRHCESAMKVARLLEAHEAVDNVQFPGLESYAQHELAKTQMTGFGGMIAFELKGGLEAGRKMMNALKVIRRAVSLGDTDSLIQHPASMTHSCYSEEERAAFGIGDGLIRISVGLETPEDILEDLTQALDAITGKAAHEKSMS